MQIAYVVVVVVVIVVIFVIVVVVVISTHIVIEGADARLGCCSKT